MNDGGFDGTFDDCQVVMAGGDVLVAESDFVSGNKRPGLCSQYQ